jgi:hypothetical protein
MKAVPAIRAFAASGGAPFAAAPEGPGLPYFPAKSARRWL